MAAWTTQIGFYQKLIVVLAVVVPSPYEFGPAVPAIHSV